VDRAPGAGVPRRVKEQQRRCSRASSATRTSATSSVRGRRAVRLHAEQHSDEAIESDPLPPGQVWGAARDQGRRAQASTGSKSTCGPGSGVKILNQPTPPAFRESVKVGEQNLYTRSKELVGDRNPREEEFSVQMRAMDSDKAGAAWACPSLVALCGSLLNATREAERWSSGR
jgi:ATP-dependent Lon protease